MVHKPPCNFKAAAATLLSACILTKRSAFKPPHHFKVVVKHSRWHDPQLSGGSTRDWPYIQKKTRLLYFCSQDEDTLQNADTVDCGIMWSM
jgi:hypothetical protein